MQNNVGLQTAYWSGTTPALDIHQIIELTKKANMDTIELKAGDFVPLTTEGRAALRKEIEDAGLSITINGTGLRPERDVSSSDEESHKAGIKHLCHMLDLSKEMGAKLFSGIPYGLWNTRPGADDDAIEMKKERRANAIRGLKEVAKHAEEVKVVLCLEIVNRFEQYIANTAEEGIAICEEINNPYCKLLLDTFHMNIEEDYIPDAIRAASDKGYLGYIHIGEANRKQQQQLELRSQHLDRQRGIQQCRVRRHSERTTAKQPSALQRTVWLSRQRQRHTELHRRLRPALPHLP